MTAHPMLSAVLVMDLLVCLLLAGAAHPAWQVARHWAPRSATPRQIAIENRYEAWSLAASAALAVNLTAAATLVLAIAVVLPRVVPGAMCGTGVLQACQPYGTRMLLYRLAGLMVLWLWQRLETLNRSQPTAPLTPLTARLLLVALPAAGLYTLESLRTLRAFDLAGPVDCCVAVYDLGAASAAALLSPSGTPFWWVLWIVASLVASSAALPLVRSPVIPPRASLAALVAVAALLWLPAAAFSLVEVLAAYHYQVLHHHCPWCLFQPRQYGAGFMLLAAWLVVALEGPAVWALAACGRRWPVAAPAAAYQTRRAALRLTVAIGLFTLVAAGPAVVWRLRHGAWLMG
jgi:hypothetical protein